MQTADLWPAIVLKTQTHQPLVTMTSSSHSYLSFLSILHLKMVKFLFTVRLYASAIYGVIMCLSVRHMPKWLNVESRKQCHTIAQGLVFWCQKSKRNSNEVTPKGAPNKGGVCSNSDRFLPVYRYISETVQNRDIVTTKR